MLSFSPTEEQEEIRRLAQSLAHEQLRPQARRSEKSGDAPLELWQTLAQTGLTSPFPEAYGGSGPVEAITYALIAEELAFGDTGLAAAIIGSIMGPLTVALAGNEEQQARLLPAFCDEHTGSTMRGSLAFAERSGSYSLSTLATTLHRTADGYTIDGTKRAVIYGSQSTLRVVLARLEGTAGADGLCALVLPAQVDGVQVKNETQKVGLLAAPSASYTFAHATLPASSLLGEPGNDGVVRAAALYAILRASLACGTARAALEYARDYAQGRVAFGRPIASYQGIAFLIAETAMKLDAARLLIWHAASDWDRGVAGEPLVRAAEAAQQQALKIAQAATTDAVQVLGGAGFLQDHPVEMWMRNAMALE